MKSFLTSLHAQRHIIWSLAKNDFRTRYLGSILGALWAFVLPLINLGIMWFAFQQGLRAEPQGQVPFILWLVTGMFPWAFFSEATLSSTNSIIEKAYLVKKVVFKVELLPFIKVIAALIPFVFLSAVMLCLFIAYGLWPDIYWLQVPYYAVCLCFLVLSLSWLTSSVVVFYRDLSHIVSIGLQLGFWITPIFWSPERLPQKFKFVILLNPVSYIVTGYRNSLITKVWFWSEPGATIYFWTFLVVLGALGSITFKRLRPHFADVL